MNSCQVLTVDDEVNIKTIKVKKPFITSSGKAVFNIHYNNQPLVIQTPTGHMSYSYNLYDNQRFQIEIGIDNAKFLKTIEEMCAYIISKIQRFDDTIINNKQIINPIKSNQNLRLYCNHVQECAIFDCEKNSIPITKLRSYDKIQCIFCVERVVVDSRFVITYTQLHQIKKLDKVISLNETNLFDPKPYDKMIALGIPLDGVRHKMKMDGISESIINDYNPRRLVPSSSPCLPRPLAPPPPPPPPLPSFLGRTQNPKPLKSSQLQDLFKDINNKNFKLRKTEDECNASKSSKSWLPNGYKVPSLQDILNTRSMLKKVSK